jgi:hypothetical protein
VRLLIQSILAVLLVLGTSSVAFASGSVPFNGSGTGTFIFTSATTTAATGTGHYEHLGLTTITATVTITGAATCGGGLTATELDTYTAANGDKVFLTVNDVFCPISASAFQATGSFSVTGGTGRFADASGSGAFQGSVVATSATSGTFSQTITGTISY